MKVTNERGKFDPKPEAKEVVETPSPKAAKFGVNEFIDKFLDSAIEPFHATLSEHNMVLKEASIDLALEKIGQALTTLRKRSLALKKEGKYATNQ